MSQTAIHRVGYPSATLCLKQTPVVWSVWNTDAIVSSVSSFKSLYILWYFHRAVGVTWCTMCGSSKDLLNVDLEYIILFLFCSLCLSLHISITQVYWSLKQNGFSVIVYSMHYVNSSWIKFPYAVFMNRQNGKRVGYWKSMNIPALTSRFWVLCRLCSKVSGVPCKHQRNWFHDLNGCSSLDPWWPKSIWGSWNLMCQEIWSVQYELL